MENLWILWVWFGVLGVGMVVAAVVAVLEERGKRRDAREEQNIEYTHTIIEMHTAGIISVEEARERLGYKRKKATGANRTKAGFKVDPGGKA